MFRLIFLSILTLTNVLGLEKLVLSSQIGEKNSEELLKSISKNAIKIGDGKLHSTYVFVDPMCPFSKRYMEQIMKNELSQKHTTYHIFLYKLPKFESTNLIKYIYQSQDRLQTLKTIMVDNPEKDYTAVKLNSKTQKQDYITDIAHVAEKLKIEVRPYIMEFQKGSRYCTVSHGDAPCLEENNF